MKLQVSTELTFIFMSVLSVQDVFCILLNGYCEVDFNHSFYTPLCNTSL